jgi:MFS family permease
MLRAMPRWLQALLLGQVVNAAGSLAWLYLTLYLVKNRGLTPGRAGLVAATYGLGSIAGNLTGGSIGDRFGLRPALVGSLAGWAASCAVFPLAPPSWLAALALLAGLTGGFGRPLMGALVATSLPTGQRREGIALFRAASNLGTVLGPPLGGLLAATHFELVFVIDAATSLVLLVAVVRWCPRAARVVVADAPRSILHALRHDRQMVMLLITVLAVDTTYRLLYTVVPLFLTARGAAPVAYGLTVSANCIVIVLFEPRIARRLSERDAVTVISAGFAVVGAGWLVLGAAPAVLTVFCAVVVITVGEMLYKPTATARAADLAPPGMVGRYQSLYAAASISGMLLSPLVGGALYEASGRLVWPAAGVLALVAAVALRQSRPRRQKSAMPRQGLVRRSST